MNATTLPKGIEKSDLHVPADYKSYDKVPYEQRSFELWHVTRFGWCIPTLLIGRARRANSTDRTYAVTVEGGQVVRVGRGPHVTATHVVHVTNARHAALKSFLTLREKGQGDAGQIRDRISSRRAQGQLMRAEGRSSWRWNV
jgi:hypothetical protein